MAKGSKVRPSKPKVYISYAHKTPKIRPWVEKIRKQLESRGRCHVIVDDPAKTPMDWTTWKKFMRTGLAEADRVVLLCTPEYKQAWENEGYQKGKGVEFERTVIQGMLEKDVPSDRFILCTIDGDIANIPDTFDNPVHVTHLNAATGFQTLRSRVRGVVARVKPKGVGRAGAAAPVLAAMRRGALRMSQMLRVEAEEQARMRIRNILGIICENAGASCAWVFRVDNRSTAVNAGATRPLLLIEAMNALETKPPPEQSIIAHVSRTARPYLALNIRARHGTDQQEPFYFPLRSSTNSELAIPIFGPPDLSGKEELLGVLNLESDHQDTFFEVYKPLLISAARELAAELLILGYPREHEARWHPERHGWGRDMLLERFCFQVVNQISLRENALRPSCTIWCADWESRQMFVRGASGFDYEYAAQRTLPIDDSCIGSVVTDEKGPVAYFLDEAISEYKFRRPQKAKAMAVNQLVNCPLINPDTGNAVGVLSLYFFLADPAKARAAVYRDHPRNPGPDNSAVAAIAQDAVKLVLSAQRLERAVAAAYLAHRTANDALPALNEFDIVRETVKQIFQADGCSVFIHQPANADWPERLACLSTTGLLDKGDNPIKAKEAFYPLDLNGLTTWIFKNPEKVLRRTSTADQEATQTEFKDVVPYNRYRETFSVSQTEHRPFLGFAVHDGQRALGVIRLVRSSRAKPFVKADEKLAHAVAGSLLHIFQAACARSKSEPQALTSLVHHVVSISTSGQQQAGDEPDRSISGAIRRLAHPCPSGVIWSRRQVDALLQDLVKVFQSRSACLANVRFLTDDENHRQMRYIGFHSAMRNDVPDEPYLFCKADPDTSVGAYVMGRQTVVTFDGKCPKHEMPRHKDWRNVRCGINFPITFTGIGRLSRGVLALDFSEQVEFTPDILDVCFLTARKLCSLAFDHPVARYPGYSECANWHEAFKIFLNEVIPAAGVAACDIVDDKLQPVTALYKAGKKARSQLDRATNQQVLLVRAEKDYEVRAFEGGGLLLPLRYGPFPTGLSLRVVLKTLIPNHPNRANELFLKCLDLYALWHDFSTATVGPAFSSLFRVRFDSHFNEREQLTEWKHFVALDDGGPSQAAQGSTETIDEDDDSLVD